MLDIDGRTIAADQVVVATGPFQTPFVPKLAEQLDPDVWQAHTTGYRRPSDVPEGTVLVVGGGNTGFQIAKELSAAHRVVLSVGSKQKPLPQRIAGRDLFWWLTKTGLIHKTVESRLAQRLKDRDTLMKSGGKPFVVMGRTMGAFVVAPSNFREKPAELKKWLARSIAFAASLPPKAKKKKR